MGYSVGHLSLVVCLCLVLLSVFPPGLEANDLAGADEIVLRDKVYILTISGPPENASVSGDLDIRENLTVTGAGRDMTFVSGGRIDRVFQVRPGVNQAAFKGLTIQNGLTPSDGAGIFNEGGLVKIVRSEVSGNNGHRPVSEIGGMGPTPTKVLSDNRTAGMV